MNNHSFDVSNVRKPSVGSSNGRPLAPPVHNERHRPGQTTLYRLVQQHAETFFAQNEVATGAGPLQFVKDECDALSSAASWRMVLCARAATPAATTSSSPVVQCPVVDR